MSMRRKGPSEARKSSGFGGIEGSWKSNGNYCLGVGVAGIGCSEAQQGFSLGVGCEV